MGITHSRTLAAGYAVAEGPQGVCGWRAGVRMLFARAWEADAMACARAWRKVCAHEWQWESDMEISASLPAAPGRCSAHHRDELVVPLLLVVVHEAEKLADAHVVRLRGGGWVSSAEGSGSHYRPNGCRS